MKVSQARAKSSSSAHTPYSSEYAVSLRLARLHALLSRLMNSEQGFDPVIGPAFGVVCQALIVSWYCTPGSAQNHAASAISRQTARASCVAQTRPSTRDFVWKVPPISTARMNASVTRTLLLAFWPPTVRYASPSMPPENPAAISACAFFSSFTFQRMKSRISGWSMSRTTIFAARREFDTTTPEPVRSSVGQTTKL